MAYNHDYDCNSVTGRPDGEDAWICVEPSPADVADLRAPTWVFECAEQGIDPMDCDGPPSLGGAM